jgi:hypothetical protein
MAYGGISSDLGFMNIFFKKKYIYIACTHHHVKVNASPSLTTSTESDRVMKSCLLRDIYSIVAPGVPPSLPEYVSLTPFAICVSNFDLIGHWLIVAEARSFYTHRS